jgi:hypothetical protein
VTVPLPNDVREFIGRHIESVAQLETLLLIRKEPQRSWTADELARRLYLSDKMCKAMLDDLARQNYLICGPDHESFAYAGADLPADKFLGLLADLYLERRVAVISEIHSKPISKVRTFADAFRFRKDDPA